ncbi:TRAP transporter substrate-binding protein [Anoxynatronum buryatiense]|uniref:Tripartite ATP-independent transporter solute receptor, DctP family n=1 Tax=Anoxynatronum buryatiense TaxID=489973 RepID=A0AA45WVP0_9CLOT|nr:TRAP transporter substrate-binding protein [Anoxynatronum buryatiense]SMP53301.1 tripartite ATP-independent transporter solute receptor, DctP family [Anoxynatronum buryatiense]
MMKKNLAILMCCVLVLSMLAGCGGGGQQQAAAGGGGTDAGSSAGADAETYTIRFAHIENEFTAAAQGCQLFKKHVEELSNGRIVVDILGAGALGGEREIVESVTMANIEAGMAMSSLFSTYLPNWEIFDLPFVFKDRDDWAAKVDGELGQMLAAETASINMKVLSYFDGGFRSISNTKRPVASMADLSGLKVRVGESTLLINTQQALGSNPIPMSFGEIYTALQQGTIDGVDTSIIYVIDGNFQEVAEYCTETNHSALQMVTFINQDFYNSLPADLQEAVDTAAAKATVEQRVAAVEADLMAIEVMEEAGMQVDQASAAFSAEMIEAAKPVVDGYRDKIDASVFEAAGL